MLEIEFIMHTKKCMLFTNLFLRLDDKMVELAEIATKEINELRSTNYFLQE